MSAKENQRYISLAKATEGTPYTQEYLSLLVRKGKLHAKKFGRNWFTTKAAVEQYTWQQKQNYISLGRAAEGTPYSQEYLSLLVRKGRLRARKFGRNWFTTQAAVERYMRRQKEDALQKAALIGRKEAKPILFAPRTPVERKPSARSAISNRRAAAVSSRPHAAAPKQKVFFAPALSRFVLDFGKDVCVITGTLALSVIIGALMMHLVQNTETEATGSALPQHGVHHAVMTTLQKSKQDFSDAVNMFTGGEGFEKRNVMAALTTSLGSISSSFTDFVYGLLGQQEQAVATKNFIPPATPTPLARLPFTPPTLPTLLIVKRSWLSPATAQRVATITTVHEVVRQVEQRAAPVDLSQIKSEVLASMNQLNADIRAYVARSVAGLSSSVSTASSQAASGIQMVSVSQDISNLISPTIQKGFTLASGDFAITKGSIVITSGDITADNINSRNTLSAGGNVGIGGNLFFSHAATTSILSSAVNAFSIATSTIAIPMLTFDTLNDRIGVGTTSPGSFLAVQGVGNFVSGATSTLYAGFSIPVLAVSSATATSTFANGIQLSAGCFRLANGNCAADGGSTGTTINNGAPNRLSYYSAATTLDSANYLAVDTANSRLGIASGTPRAILSLENLAGANIPAMLVATTTAAGATSTAFVIDNLGKLGIGTTSPSSQLAVNGGIFVNGNTGVATSSVFGGYMEVQGAAATSTFFGGVNAKGGLLSGNGLTLTGGNIFNLTTGTSTVVNGFTATGILATAGLNVTGGGIFNTVSGTSTVLQGALTAAGILSTNGLTVTAGNIYNATTGTSTVVNGLSATGIAASAGLSLTGGGFRNTVSGTSTLLTGNLDAAGIAASNGITLTGGNLSTANTNLTIQTGGANNILLNPSNGGNVGIGTTSPAQLFSVAGHCVTGDTRLRRRRRKLKVAPKFGAGPDPKDNQKTAFGAVFGGLRSVRDPGLSPAGSIAGGEILSSSDTGDNFGTVEVAGIEPARVIGQDSSQSTPTANSSYHEYDDYIYDEVRIDEVQAGDEIASLDEHTGRIVWSRVNALMDMGVKITYRLRTEDGREIRTTATHPYLTRKGWTKTAFLYEGVEIAVPKRLFTAPGYNGGKRHEDDAYRQDRNDEIESKHGVETAVPELALGFLAQGGIDHNRHGEQHNGDSEIEELELIHNIGTSLISINANDHKRNVANAPLMRRSIDAPPMKYGITSDASVTWPEATRTSANNFNWLSESIYRHYSGEKSDVKWVKIASLEKFGEEQVWDIEVEDTHNFVGNDIFAHNTYIHGNVGIATSSPSARFSIRGAGTGTGNMLFFEDSAGTNRLTMLDNGTIGIGTTSPGSILSVQGVANFVLQATSTLYTGLTASGYLATSSGITITGGNILSTVSGTSTVLTGNLTATGIAASNGITITGGNLSTTNTNLTIQAGGANNILLNPSNGGNVGIGTASPSITGLSGTVLTIQNTGASNRATLELSGNTGTSGTGGTIMFLNGSTRLGQVSVNADGATNSGNMQFLTVNAGTEAVRMHIDKSGNVGIGTTAPVNKLDVNGAMAIGSYAGTNTGPSNGLIVSGNVGIGTTSPSAALAVQGNALISGNLSVAGITATSTLTVSATSTATYFAASTLGSAGSPAFTFTNDSDTGMWSPTANTLALSTGGSERVRIDSNGNIGIGTTSPGALLAVNQTGGGFYVQSGGNVGIGTASPSGLGAHVLNIFAGASVASDLVLEGNSGANFTLLEAGTGPTDLGVLMFNTGMRFGYATSKAAAGFTEVMRMTTAGNVGIGNTSPASTLEVTGVIASALGTVGAPSKTFAGDLDTGMWSSGANTLNLSTGGSERVRVDSGGNVGIGTANPGAISGQRILNVYGGTTQEGVLALEGNNGEQFLTMYAGSGTTDLGVMYFNRGMRFGYATAKDGTGFTEVMRMTTSGNVGIGTTSPGSILSVQGVGNFVSAATSTLYTGLTAPGYLATSSGVTITGGNLLNTTAGTSTVINDLSAAGILASNGVTLSAGNLLNKTAGTSTVLQGMTATGIAASNGITLTGGNLSTANTNLTIQTGGANNILLNPSNGGNVGIGQTSPQSVLDIAAAANTLLTMENTTANAATNRGDIIFQLKDSNNALQNFARIGAISSVTTAASYGGDLAFYTAGSGTGAGAAGQERMRINNIGNVGIGTTTPGARTEIVSNSAGATTDTLFLSNQATGTSTASRLSFRAQDTTGLGTTTASLTGIITSTATTTGNGQLAFSTLVNGLLTESFRIASSSNLGIGTTTPNWLLQVNGTRPSLALSDSSASANLKHWLFSSMGGNLYVGTSTDAYATSTPAALTILNTGNVGIGTTGPTSNIGSTVKVLDLKGSSAGGGYVLHSPSSAQEASFWSDGGGTYLDVSGHADAANNRIFLRTSGTNSNFSPTERMTILSNGNVGIGTTSPSSLLALTGGGITLQNAGDKPFAIASTTATFYSGVSTEVTNQLINFGANDTRFGMQNTNIQGAFIRVDTRAGFPVLQTWVRAAGSGSLTEAMDITSAGNVGIGTTGPLRKSDVYDSTSLGTAANSETVIAWLRANPGDASNTGLRISQRRIVAGNADAISTGIRLAWAPSAGAANINAGRAWFEMGNAHITALSNNVFRWGINAQEGSDGTELMRLDANGNVGIGTTSPLSKLAVSGGASIGADYNIAAPTNGMIIQGNVSIGTTTNPGAPLGNPQLTLANNGNPAGLAIDNSGTSQNGYPFVYFSLRSTIIGSIKDTSDTGVQYNTTSDRRVKENIATSTLGLETLMKIPVSDFNFISDPDKKRMQGFIAQDLYNYYPEAVSVGGESASNPWMVDYGRITPLLMKAIQEQQAKIEELDSAIHASSTTATALATSAWSVDQQSGKVNVSFFGNINMQGHDILDVGKITGYLGKWSIDQEGTLVAVKIITDEVITKKLAVSEAAVFGSSAKPIGITIYDEATAAPYCIKVKNGAMVNEAGACNLTSPIAGGTNSAPAPAPSSPSDTASTTSSAPTPPPDTVSTTPAATDTAATSMPVTAPSDVLPATPSVPESATSTPIALQ